MFPEEMRALVVARRDTIAEARAWLVEHGNQPALEWLADEGADAADVVRALEEAGTLGCIGLIIDAAFVGDDETVAMDTLIRVLSPGGRYVRLGAGGARVGTSSRPVQDLVQAVGWSDRERRRLAITHSQAMVSGIALRGNEVVYEKTRRAGTQHPVRALNDVASEVLTFDSGRELCYDRVPGRLVGPVPERIARQFDALVAQRRVEAPPSLVGRIDDATVLAFGLIVDAKKAIVRESLFNNHHRDRLANLFAAIPNTGKYVAEINLANVPMADVEGPVVLLKQSSDRNYGHWVVDTLPRVVPALKFLNGERATWIVNGVKSSDIARLYTDSLATFGVPASDVLFDDYDAKRYRHVVYPSPMSMQPSLKSPTLIGILEELGARFRSSRESRVGGRRIYLSRRAYSRRRLLNEDAIFSRLKPLGFEMVLPERLSFRQQVTLFADADAVAGVMGAGFSSLAFSPRGVKALCLAPEFMAHDYFYDIVCHKRGMYVGVQGRSEVDESVRPIDRDFTMDMSDVERAIDIMFA